jgi:hypothetical protein
MQAKLPGPDGSGSSTPPAQEALVKAVSSRFFGFAPLVLFTVPVLLTPAGAAADIGATDRHEIPSFVLDRIELVTGAPAVACPLPCGRPGGSVRCASRVPGPTLDARGGIRSDAAPDGACAAGGAD